MLLVDDFARATGLDPQIVSVLVRDRRVEGLYHADGRVFGVFDDALPSAAELRSWGLEVSDAYDPDRHRSHVSIDDQDPATSTNTAGTNTASTNDAGEDDADDPSAPWTMSWGDADD